MKKYIILIFVGVFAFTLPSCLEKYLDKAPESGLSKADVFSKYENFKLFFDAVYNRSSNLNIKCAYPLWFDMSTDKFTWESLTDLADQGRMLHSQLIKSGKIGELHLSRLTYTGERPVFTAMFQSIRICNTALENIKMLKDAKQEDIDDFIAQAHFVRAFCHFELFRIWGPMPYITKTIGPYDQWDIPRLSKHETLIRIAADMDTAAMFFEKAGRMRRDPGPAGVGNLSSPDQFRPNGVAAKAYKARALLYAASPLNNELGVTDWENAAIANWEAIQIAKSYQYILLTGADYKKNYIGEKYSNEQLWGWDGGSRSYNNGNLAGLVNGIFANSKSSFSGECPSQNAVDKFETQWGDPLNTQADRDAATAIGHYNEQSPYANRDPRFYIDIIYNTAPIPGYSTAKIYTQTTNGLTSFSELLDQTYLGTTKTGYYSRKRWDGRSTKSTGNTQFTDPLIRLGELYLNYAEASNEAYGPTAIGVPGATMSAVDAINLIRTRVLQPNVLAKFTTDKDSFRPRVKNERTVELMQEGGHYYFDIRRWKDAPAAYTGPVMGMNIEKVTVSAQYPDGYKYTRVPLASDRQTAWVNAMYYLPFMLDDMYKMKNFYPNELW